MISFGSHADVTVNSLTTCLINFLAPFQLTVAKLPCFPISEIDFGVTSVIKTDTNKL